MEIVSGIRIEDSRIEVIRGGASKNMSNAFLQESMLGMTWEEIMDAAKEGAVVFLPVGVVEAHGPHLPLGTDIYCVWHQALEVKKHWDNMGVPSVIAPPFYWGGTKAMTRQFPGTFTATKENITTSMIDIFRSLDQFGFSKVVLFNAHGDGLHKKAMIEAMETCNKELSIKAFWPVYEDDIEWEGFTGKEDFLALIPPMPFECFFTMEQPPLDEFDIHAGAFETALMQEIMPELVRNEKIEGLEPTLLNKEQRRLWNEGERENINIIPKGYVGDPAGSKYMKSDMKKVNEAFAKGLAKYLGVI